jgi:hypothetical protein
LWTLGFRNGGEKKENQKKEWSEIYKSKKAKNKTKESSHEYWSAKNYLSGLGGQHSESP